MILAQQNEEADDIEYEAENEEEELRKKLALSGLKMYGNKEGGSSTGTATPKEDGDEWEDVDEGKKDK